MTAVGNGPRIWWRALVGFYRAPAAGNIELDLVARFLFAARSVILVISLQALLIAGLLAWTDGHFDALAFVLVIAGFVVAHAISNLSNDYFGYRRGHDTPDSPRLRYTIHPVAGGLLTTRQLATGLIILGAVGLAIVAYFTVVRGPLALAFAVAGIALLFLYDASPVPLKSIGLGEVASFLVWGPLMVGGGYYVISGQLSATPFLASIPYGLGVASILIGKHIDQREFDREHGLRTLPVVLGERTARLMNGAVIAGIYVGVAALVLTGTISVLAAVVVVALPRAIHALAVMARPRPDEPPPGYVGWPLWYHRVCLVHNRLFGWAYIGGLALGAVFGWRLLW